MKQNSQPTQKIKPKTGFCKRSVILKASRLDKSEKKARKKENVNY